MKHTWIESERSLYSHHVCVCGLTKLLPRACGLLLSKIHYGWTRLPAFTFIQCFQNGSQNNSFEINELPQLPEKNTSLIPKFLDTVPWWIAGTQNPDSFVGRGISQVILMLSHVPLTMVNQPLSSSKNKKDILFCGWKKQLKMFSCFSPCFYE